MDTPNYIVFRDCFSDALISRIATAQPKKKAKRKVKSRLETRALVEPNDATESAATQSSDAEDMAEFIEYLASEIFFSLSEDLQTLSYAKVQDDTSLRARYDSSELMSTSPLVESLLQRLPSSVTDSLEAYALLGPDAAFAPLMISTLGEYVSAVTAAPPVWASTRTAECEICARDWVPLSYHHLIPKQVHDKALRRRWHEEWRLNSVAWLCRACHSFVHRCESNEALARDYWTIEKLLAREDVQQWAKWVSRVRWKAK